jgi:hypothetical protein
MSICLDLWNKMKYMYVCPSKFYYSDSIIISNFVETLIPNCWFENVFPTYIGIEI